MHYGCPILKQTEQQTHFPWEKEKLILSSVRDFTDDRKCLRRGNRLATYQTKVYSTYIKASNCHPIFVSQQLRLGLGWQFGIAGTLEKVILITPRIANHHQALILLRTIIPSSSNGQKWFGICLNSLEPVSSRCRLLGPMVPFFPGCSEKSGNASNIQPQCTP